MMKLLLAVLVAVVAGLILLAVEYSWFNPRRSPEEPKTAQSPEDSKAPPDTPVPVAKATTQRADDLQALRQTAKRITSSATRDAELTTVARLAVEKKQYQFAVDVAKDITYSANRDKVLEFIACFALNLSGDRASAELAAGAVTSSAKRDDLYRAIVKRAASKDESNDFSCPKL